MMTSMTSTGLGWQTTNNGKEKTMVMATTTAPPTAMASNCLQGRSRDNEDVNDGDEKPVNGKGMRRQNGKGTMGGHTETTTCI